jgi:hypothetical protein
LAAWDKQAAWSQAKQDRFLAAMAEDPVVPTPVGELDKEWVREEVACALRLSSGHAANRLRVARELAGRLPDTLDLQERGEITSHHSRSLAEATMPLDQVSASKVEDAVLVKAPDQALASFRRSVKRSLLKHAPQTAEQAHEHGMRPAIQVSVALSTLLGMDEQPGEPAGSGPIPASVARNLAPTGDRSDGQVDRLRQDDVPAAQGPGRSRHRPRPNLPLPTLPTTSLPLRSRSQETLGTHRRNERTEPALTVLSTPSRQARRWLDTQATGRRVDRMDVTDRTQLRRTASDLSDRRNRRTQRGRSRPSAALLMHACASGGAADRHHANVDRVGAALAAEVEGDPLGRLRNLHACRVFS